MWRRLPAFSGDSVKRLVKHPRGYPRDSGLLHALLRIPDRDALLSHPQMGASWEGMLVEVRITGADPPDAVLPHQHGGLRIVQNIPGQVRHFSEDFG